MSASGSPYLLEETAVSDGSQRVIAIRKQPVSARDYAPEVRSAFVETMTSASWSAASLLAEQGLPPAERRWSGPNPAENYAQELPLTQCMILNSRDNESLLRAVDVLQDDFEIIPDVPVALAASEASAEGVPSHTFSFPGWGEKSGVEQARHEGERGANAIVAVLDTGVDADHDEFNGREIPYAWIPPTPSAQPRLIRGIDPGGHGTHVAGIIGGSNVGIAPDAQLLVASVIESETVRSSLSRIITALDWTLRQITRPENDGRSAILNMSLGFRREWLAPSDVNRVLIGVRLLLTQLVEDFRILPVVAIGNDGPGVVRAPGYFAEVLSVGAVDNFLQPADFSGGGNGPPPFDSAIQPAVVGFGVDIQSSHYRDSSGCSYYNAMSGTSMAAPYVAGIAALLGSASGLHGSELRDLVMQNALPTGHPLDRTGAGLARYSSV
jgi:hypothetical protein